MSETAWAAGLFEGEGSITHSLPVLAKPGRRLAQLSMGSTDLDVLARFRDAVGFGKVYGPYKTNGRNTPAGRKPIYQWRISRINEVQTVLRMFWPYLGERRRAKAAGAIASYFESVRMPQRAHTKYRES
jgi:hypothetical protein